MIDGGRPVSELLKLLQKISRIGGEPADLLRKAGAGFLPADLENGRVTAIDRRLLVAIYREAIVTIGWHSSRLDRKPQMHPDEFRLMCHCVITCRTLEQVIERQAAFFRTRLEKISTIWVERGEGTAHILVDTLRRRTNLSSFLSDLAGMSMFCRLYGWLLGTGEHVFSVGLAYDERYAAEAVSDFFSGELAFGCAVNRISLPAHMLSMPIVRTSEDLDRLLIDFPFDFLAASPDSLALPDRVRTLYAMALAREGRLPTLEQLAEVTGRSQSSLRRHLAEAGCSVRMLREEAQRGLATEALAVGSRSIDDIALRSGFRDTGSFRAAFRRWTGLSPAAYRRARRDAGEILGSNRETLS